MPEFARAGRVGVLALQGDVREHIRALADLGARPVEVRTEAELDTVDAMVLPGGESTTMSVLLDSSGLLEPLRARLRAGLPAFGTCAGMILLASEVVDGRTDQHRFNAIDIGVRRNAFGRQIDSFETDLVVDGFDGSFHAVFIRAPVVEWVGPDVTVLARLTGTDGRSRPVVCQQGPVLVSAFHPELSGDGRLHRLFLESASRRGEPASSGMSQEPISSGVSQRPISSGVSQRPMSSGVSQKEE